jgi:hypothetical protein
MSTLLFLIARKKIRAGKISSRSRSGAAGAETLAGDRSRRAGAFDSRAIARGAEAR